MASAVVPLVSGAMQYASSRKQAKKQEKMAKRQQAEQRALQEQQKKRLRRQQERQNASMLALRGKNSRRSLLSGGDETGAFRERLG
jgi:Skp family chaperone for outer membrane proteins